MDDTIRITSLRAILDIGFTRYATTILESDDTDITIVDASSDMLVIDISIL
jgi:hypothetical protein